MADSDEYEVIGPLTVGEAAELSATHAIIMVECGRLVESLKLADVPPDVLIDCASILLQYWAAVKERNDGVPPGATIKGGTHIASKDTVRLALGKLAGLLRESGAM